MADVNLNMIGYSVWISLEIVGQTLITELHEKDEVSRVGLLVCPEVLHYIGVLDSAEKAAFLVELFQRNVLGSWIVHDEKSRMHDLGCTQQLVTSRLANCPVRTGP